MGALCDRTGSIGSYSSLDHVSLISSFRFVACLGLCRFYLNFPKSDSESWVHMHQEAVYQQSHRNPRSTTTDFKKVSLVTKPSRNFPAGFQEYRVANIGS